MNLGILLSPGDSLEKQQQSGQLERLLNDYLPAYSIAFERVYIFSYGDQGKKFILPPKVWLLPKPRYLSNYLYQILVPFIHCRIIKNLNLIRVFQAPGGLPAIISRLIYRVPYIVSFNYDYVAFARLDNKPLLVAGLKLILPLVRRFSRQIISPKNIPNGVAVDRFQPKKDQLKLGLVLSVGRLVKQKNHDLLIKTISQSRSKAKIKLIIIGAGPRQNRLEKLAKKLRVNLVLHQTVSHHQLAEYYQAAQVFALTSLLEGQPKALLEAMSCGCACLTTAFPGNIIKDGETGMVGHNLTELTQKLDQLLTNDQLNKNLGTKARKLIVSQFNLKTLLLKEIKLLKSWARK